MQPYAEMIRRLDQIPGVDRLVAWTMVAELGPDMKVFPDADHAVSWAGLCPGNCQSGGKRKKSRTRKANPYLRRDLCQAAWAASHAEDSYLSAMYRRMRGGLGHNQAIFAVAHQILRIAYTMLRRGEDYRELGSDYYDQRNKPKVVHRLVERLTRLGYRVWLEEVEEPTAGSSPAPSATTATERAESAATPTEPNPRDAPSPDEVGKSPKRGRPCKCAKRGITCLHQRNKSEAKKIQTKDTGPT